MYENHVAADDYFDSSCREPPKDLASLLREQLEAQSAFCSCMGSVLSNLLWDLSKCPQIACTLTQKHLLSDLLEIVRSAVNCYNAACQRNREAWPAGLSADETKLAIGLAGLAANLAAVAPNVIIQCGHYLIRDFINIIPGLQADPLRKVLLDFLYNISLDEAGAAKLQEKAVIKAISKALTACPEIRLSALKLLASLTSRDIPPTLISLLPFEQVRTLYHTGDAEMSHYASIVLENIKPLIDSDR